VIRIRFPAGAEVPAFLVEERRGVAVTADPAVLAAEGEKNGATQLSGVDRVLRPLFEAMWSRSPRMFHLVSVETRSGCNYECSFCPVSRSVDPRPPGEMSLELLEKIVDDLVALDFTGRVALFGNNEPLLDGRLVGIVEMFRVRLPAADLRLLSNGTRATAELVTALFRAGLSTLIINNYTDGRRLTAPVRRLIDAAARLTSFDIRVSVRDRHERLTTRAGLAPNNAVPAAVPRGFCALPFTDLHIAYTGQVNLCCFDAYGRVSMGNVAVESIRDIWVSTRFAPYRQSLLRSERSPSTPCGTCDFDGFREPTLNRERPLTRSDLIAGEEPS
jgi:MoaA/NifB/PqqE/SkfB family radical SAM enzyme